MPGNDLTLSTSYQRVAFLPANLRVSGSAAAMKYAANFSGTTITILGVTHGLGSKDLLIMVYDSATPAHVISPGSITVHPTTFDVVLTFAETQAGRVVML